LAHVSDIVDRLESEYRAALARPAFAGIGGQPVT